MLGCILVGSLALCVLAAPRFAHAARSGPSTGPTFVTSDGDRYQGMVTDQVEYFRLTEHYAGRGPAPDTSPFTGRLLVPWIAGQLPFSAPVAFNLVSLALLVVGLASLVLLLASWRLRPAVLVAATTIYAISFPVAWYGGASWVDGASVGLIGLCVLAAYRRWWLGLVALVPAMLTKESALVCVVFGIALELTRPSAGSTSTDPSRPLRWARASAWVVVGAASMVLIRIVAVAHQVVFAPWVPGDLSTLRDTVASNLRASSGISTVLLTGVIPLGILAVTVWGVARRRIVVPSHVLVPLTCGALGVIALSALALVGALWDGRLIWATYPFVLPLGSWVLDDALARRAARSEEPAPRPGSVVRSVVQAVAAVGIVLVAMAVVIAVAGALGRAISPGSEVVDPGEVSFADRLGDLRLSSNPEVTGVGDRTVDLPDSDGPLLVDYSYSGDGTFQLATEPDGTTVASTRDPGSGTAYVDPSTSDQIRVSASGPWRLRFRSISDAFNWGGYAPMTGASDAVLLIPGGAAERRRIRLVTEDPDAGVQFVSSDGLVQPLPGDGDLPPGAQAVIVRADRPWDLSAGEVHGTG